MVADQTPGQGRRSVRVSAASFRKSPPRSGNTPHTIAAGAAGVKPKVRGSRIGGYVVRMIGAFQPDVGEVAEMLYQFQKPLEVSHAKFEEAFGASPTPHADAMATTLDWYRAHRAEART